jgi:anti-anti-sigma regulatory factor
MLEGRVPRGTMTLELPRVQLSVDNPDAAADLAGAVDAVLARRDRAPALIIDLDGEHLPTAVVSALIASLRQLREVGGAIAINATTQPLRDALALYGLDRVFAH